jgi:hypothetical protein
MELVGYLELNNNMTNIKVQCQEVKNPTRFIRNNVVN